MEYNLNKKIVFFATKILKKIKTTINNKFLNKIFNYIFFKSENVIITEIKKFLTNKLKINLYWMKFSLRSKTFVETEFLDLILDKIGKPEIILDLGSASAFQSIEFSIVFPDAKIYAFECNPLSIKKCHENIKNLENVEIVGKAVYSIDGFIKFYPVLNNNDASSLYKFSKDYFNAIKKFEQKTISVKATRIDTWAKEKKIKKIDLCWLDLQGAEYEAIEGLGDLIYNVQALYIEVAEKPLYVGQKLINDIKNLLENKGFSMLKYFPTIPGWYGNAIFLNNNLLA